MQPAVSPDAAAPASPTSIPSVAALQRRKSRKRFWIGFGITATAVTVGGGALIWLINRSITDAMPKRPEPARPAPVAATAARTPVFPQAAPAPAPAPAPAAQTGTARTDYTVPAPLQGDEVRPVPLKGSAGYTTGSGAPAPAPRPKRDPRDAPMMVISSAAATARDLAAIGVVRVAGDASDIAAARQRLSEQRAVLQERLNQVLQQAPPAGQPGAAPGMPPLPLPGLPGMPPGVMPDMAAKPKANPLSSATTVAGRMRDPRLTIPFGTNAQCQMQNRIATTARGSFTCMVARDVRGADGTTVLLDAGSIIEADYEAQNVPLGVNAIPILRPRVRTPDGAIFDLPGDATGPLGEGGLPGHLNERWAKRLGPAVFMSLVSDAAKVAVAKAGEGASNNTVVIGGGTLQQGDRLASDVARRSLDIPAVFTANQGTTVFFHFRESVYLGEVYALEPKP